jgi:hypothetical protein
VIVISLVPPLGGAPPPPLGGVIPGAPNAAQIAKPIKAAPKPIERYLRASAIVLFVFLCFYSFSFIG